MICWKPLGVIQHESKVWSHQNEHAPDEQRGSELWVHRSKYTLGSLSLSLLDETSQNREFPPGSFHSWVECTRALCYASTTRDLTKPAWGYMQQSSTHEVTGLLRAWSGGDQGAIEKLTPLVYEQLHRIAQRYMAAERSDHTLQATALIHEVYLRLVDVREINWQGQGHFFALCAQLMRRILTDFARSRHYQKRGGDTV